MTATAVAKNPPVKYVCYNFFPWCADYQINDDVVPRLYEPNPLNLDTLKEGDKVFVKTDYLDAFVAQILPQIRCKFTLITGKSDLTATQRAAQAIMDSPNIIHWYACNMPIENAKITAIPIGFSEPYNLFGNQEAIDRVYNNVPEAKIPLVFQPSQSISHPMRNIPIPDHPHLVKHGDHLEFEEFLSEMAKYKFTLCTRGNGMDIHRVYEAIALKTRPIFFSDCIPANYNRLPIIWVKSIDELVHVLNNLGGIKDISEKEWENARRTIQTEYYRF